LTFFQQIGGTFGLTIAGTVLVERLATEIPAQLLAAGTPAQFVAGFAGGGATDVTGTGDLGQRILASLPADAQAAIQPLIPAIVHAIHEAFSIAIASTFWVGIAGAIIAAVCVLFLREEPMRTTFEME
jgi:phosphoenolpyruvate-protein kinase (PTS system EI component)